jgi:hypothetical protein
MSYGLKVKDNLGNSCLITPEVKHIISSGTVSLPTNLRPDNTFGINIALPGLTAYAENNIGVLVTIKRFISYQVMSWLDWGLVPKQWSVVRWLVYGGTYFTRNETTGVVSAFTVEQYKDTIYNLHPVAFWDKMGATTFNFVRLFAGVSYTVYDNSAAAYKIIYHLGLISSIDYTVYLKNV